MKHRQVNRPIAIAVTVIMFICMALITFQGKAQVQPRKMESGKEYHLRLQKENSWENYQNNRVKAAKATRKAKKEQSQLARREEKIRAKIRRIEG